jgi:hypothetical protein
MKVDRIPGDPRDAQLNTLFGGASHHLEEDTEK